MAHTESGLNSNMECRSRSTMKKILIFGCNGQLGEVITSRLSRLSNVLALSHSDYGGDITNFIQVAEIINAFEPDLIINAAAYTAVDKAELEYDLAFKVNSEAVKFLALECHKRGIVLVHYSTDYVFSGQGDIPYTETDTADPINVYGRSKLAGENAIRSILHEHLILRTSWLYGAKSGNFFSTILKRGLKHQQLKVVKDQIGTPTSVDFLADITEQLVRLISSSYRSDIYGTYHVVPDGYTNRYDLAKWLIAQACVYSADYENIQIEAITTSEFHSTANRPLNSRLSNTKLKNLISDSYNIEAWDFYAKKSVQFLLNEATK